jgi:hypothetical protein
MSTASTAIVLSTNPFKVQFSRGRSDKHVVIYPRELTNVELKNEMKTVFFDEHGKPVEKV